MAIEKMMLLNMTFDRHELDDILSKIKSDTDFYPQLASKIVNNVKGVHALSEDDAYTKVIDRLIQISSDIKLDLQHHLAPEKSLDLNKTDVYLTQLEEEINKIKKVQDELVSEKQENEKTLEMLEKMSLSEVDFDHLMNSHYMKVRFGRLKRQNLDKIKYYEGRPFIFHKLGEDSHYIWCCYIVTNNLMLEIDNIFKALGFDEVHIPSFVHGTLKDAKTELKTETDAMQEYIMRMDQKITILRETHKVDLLKLYTTAYDLKDMSSYKKYIVDYQHKCAVYGFIAKDRIESWKEKLKDIPGVEYQVLPANILEEHGVVAPTVVRNAKIVEPFEAINKVKVSDNIDTTIAVAILYYAVFIVFLGDLGIGAILTLLGLLLRKNKLSHFFLAIGIASLIGGFVYGEAFYTIRLYPALALPLSTLYRLLDGVVLLIAGTYTIGAFKKMYLASSLRNKVFSMRGLCGLICIYAILVYLGCVYEAHIQMAFMPIAIVIAACLVLIIVNSIIKKK